MIGILIAFYSCTDILQAIKKPGELSLTDKTRVKIMERIDNRSFPVLGVDISPHSRQEFFETIKDQLIKNGDHVPPLLVVTVNPEIIMDSILDGEFKEIINQSTLKTADGVGVSWAVRFIYRKSIERITGSDSVEELCKISAQLSQPVFFYGAAPGIAQKAADILTDKIQNLTIAGTYSPPTTTIPFEDLPENVQQSLEMSSVIFVALGAPAQEKWIHRNLRHLKSCKLIIGVGGSFDFIAGNIKRAPVAFRKSGLEWVYRLYLQPSRWKRMMKLPLFVANVILLKSRVNAMKKSA